MITKDEMPFPKKQHNKYMESGIQEHVRVHIWTQRVQAAIYCGNLNISEFCDFGKLLESVVTLIFSSR